MVLLSRADLSFIRGSRQSDHVHRARGAWESEPPVGVHPVSSAAGHEDLLESWFGNELAPLCGRHRELSQEPGRRKAEALLENVTAALRSKAGAPAAVAEHDIARFGQTERGLREVAGRIGEARQSCHSAADSIRSPGTKAVESAAPAGARNASIVAEYTVFEGVAGDEEPRPPLEIHTTF
jgi:hypothetical protein